LVTSRGDTIDIPNGARLEFKVDHPANHAKAGVVLGYIVGTITMYAQCEDKKYCAEQNPTALLGALVGGIIGRFMTEDWDPIAWATP
jgi:hypothetical protein